MNTVNKPAISFLDLHVYQRSYQAALVVHRKIIPALPNEEKYNLGDQMGRASKAIPALIAEGYAKKHQNKNWQKYLNDALSEANEMIVHLSFTKDLYSQNIDSEFCETLIGEYNIIGKQLFNLKRKWGPHPHYPSPNSTPTTHNS